jgi:hypothetical protein
MRMNSSTARILVVALVAMMAMTIAIPIASYAGNAGSRNTALVLGGLSAYLFANGKTGAGLASAVGAAIALSASSDRDDRYYRHRNYYNDDRYYRDSDRNGFQSYDKNRNRDRERFQSYGGDRDRNKSRGSDRNRDRNNNRNRW